MFGSERMSPCHWVFVVGTQNLSICYNGVGGGRGEYHGWCTENGFTFSYWDWIQGGALSPMIGDHVMAWPLRPGNGQASPSHRVFHSHPQPRNLSMTTMAMREVVLLDHGWCTES